MRTALVLLALTLLLPQASAPIIWNDAALSDWETPIARLNVRPGHFNAEEYAATPADNFRTYPVYPPDREPSGYWDWLQQQKPEPLVDASQMRSREDWIAAGERAFREVDFVLARTNDPEIIARTRERHSFRDTYILTDGTVSDPRWVVTNQGLMLTTTDCASCHVRFDESDRTLKAAGPMVPWPPSNPLIRPPGFPITEFFGRMLSRLFLDEPFGIAFWRTTATPWAPEPRVDELRNMKGANDLGSLFRAPGATPRVNGSPFYGAKVADLHLLRYYKYLDATGTHRLRGPEDVARYMALVSSANPMEFGPHHMLTSTQRRVSYRFADEVLYAVGMYLMSLEPEKGPEPANPAEVESGRLVFEKESCGSCHTPPNYTNGKLTLAAGFAMPEDHPYREDVLPVSVGTDPGLALQTRKGTGFYKIPSLRGVWYRPFLLHDGSLTSLEAMFNADRLKPEYHPQGWNPPGVTTRAVPGHIFGMDVSTSEKAALIAFLKSL